MLTYRDMTPDDESFALENMAKFYDSDAVSSPPPCAVIERNVAAALDASNPMLRGVLVSLDETPVGYFMLTTFYAGEVGGLCVMIEQVYVLEAYRGKGIAREMMQWLGNAYPEARRFQLEVDAKGNPAAYNLYKNCHYSDSSYLTMFYHTGIL